MAIYTQNYIPYNRSQADYLGFRGLLDICMAKWRWFVFSVMGCVGLAIAYLLVTQPVYTRQASLLVKEENNKNDFSSEIGSFAELGIFTSSVNVNNELTTIQSPDLLREVIRRLKLDVTYRTGGTFHKQTLYGETLPLKVDFITLGDDNSCSLTLSVVDSDKVSLSDFRLNGEAVDEAPLTVSYGKETKSPIGLLVVERTPNFKTAISDISSIFVKRSALSDVLSKCQSKLSATLNGDKTSIIDLAYKDVCIRRAEDFLNTLIAVYNESWVKDKNRVAVGTSQFIDERLQVIEDELGHVDTEISSYKSTHLIPNVDAASQLNMTTANQTSVKISDLNNQLAMARFVRDQINNDKSGNQLLPANSGLDSPTIEQLIKLYNEKMLERNSLVATSSTSNPLVTDMDNNLSLMRKAILFSLDNEVNTLNTQIRGLRDLESVSTSRLSRNPKQSKYLLSVERQQKVKEALYLFLLQKREENGLSQAFTAYNTRVVTAPTGDMKPTSPVRGRILLAAFLLGLLIPVAVIYIRENLNTKVRGRKDIEQLTLPFIGEIPLHGKHRKIVSFRMSTGGGEDYKVVVQPQNRNIINEAFRVVRTNIEFMLGQERRQTIMVTSLNAGSGKTFLTMNLAASFAVKERKVAVLDLDMRRASLSHYVGSPKQGIADYLSGNIFDWEQLMVSVDGKDFLQVLPVGTIPPNPSELLSSGKLQQLLYKLSQEYDIVFLDTPPVEIVADTSVIAQWADMTIFVIRAGLMERDMLPMVENYYKEKKFKNMSVLLNGTIANSRYGYHRYGYNYGYGNYAGYSRD